MRATPKRDEGLSCWISTWSIFLPRTWSVWDQGHAKKIEVGFAQQRALCGQDLHAINSLQRYEKISNMRKGELYGDFVVMRIS
jgi:hypothetical protein